MPKEKRGFVLYKDQSDFLEDLDTEQKGILFQAIFDYQNEKEFLTEDKFVNFMLKNIIKTFERDEEKYLKKVEKNKINGKKGGRPKKEVSEEKSKTDAVKNDKSVDIIKDNEVDLFFEEMKAILKKNYGKNISEKIPTKNGKMKLSKLLNKKEEVLRGYKNYIASNVKQNKELCYVKGLIPFLNQETYLDFQESNIKEKSELPKW
jgi:hypothetical protein